MPAVLSCVCSRLKIYVFAVKSRRQSFYFCVIELMIRRKEPKFSGNLGRVPFAVNVILKLSNNSKSKIIYVFALVDRFFDVDSECRY